MSTTEEEGVDMAGRKPETDSELRAEAERIADEAAEVISAGEVLLPAPLDPAPVAAHDLAKIPEHDELLTLAQLATTFAHAGLVPKPLRGKPADVLLVLMTGRGLDLDPMVALRECHPIDGRVTVSPKLKLALVRQRGLGRVWPDPDNDDEQATWYAERADDPGTIYAGRFTMADAKRAGLAHKDNWKAYPAQMLQWRALGYLIDQAFSEVGTGLYSADELGMVTDEEGNAIIDLREVDPLPGMVKTRAQSDGPDPEAVCSDEEQAKIKDRIAALPPPATDALKAAWAKPNPQDGTPNLWPLHTLPNRQVRVAHALIDSIEKRARAGEWGEWVGHDPEDPAQDPTTSPTLPQDGPDGDPGTDGAPDQPEATQQPDEEAMELTDGQRLEAIIDAVGALAPAEVEAELLEAGIDTSEMGTDGDRRRALAAHRATEAGVPLL